MSATRRVLLLAAVLIAVAIGAAVPIQRADVVRASGPTVNGGGSSFAALEIDTWRGEVKRKPYELTLNYVAQGSTFGRTQYIQGNFDYAASDIPFTELELAQVNNTSRKDFVYVPVSAGGVGMMYNLIDANGNRVNNLKLSRRAVCSIFTVPNMFWDDPMIQSTNDFPLPHEYVRPILRADGSGTSYVLSEFCLTVAPDIWATAITQLGPFATDAEFKQGLPTSNWPPGWGKSATSTAAAGVAQAVADSSGLYAITYNEAGYAKLYPDTTANALVENANPAVFTAPTEEAVSVALAYAQPRGNGTFILNFSGSDPTAYFPSTYSYFIAQTTGFPADKGEVLARYLCYAVTKGQRVELTKELGYARLSAPLVDIARDGISKIPGAPPWDQCKVDSAPPPPAATTVVPTTQAPVVAQQGAGPTTTTATVVGAAGGGAGGGSSQGASSSAGGNSSAGSNSGKGSTATSIVVDPVTGSSSVVTVPAVSGPTDECVDPDTGLPADPSACAQVASVGTGPVSAANPAEGAVGGVQPTTTPPTNPLVVESGGGPSNTQVAWWLVQGASVCGIGVSLAGVRRRVA
jgi:phosphate transport system substrate-binding protein